MTVIAVVAFVSNAGAWTDIAKAGILTSCVMHILPTRS